jgi:hypothetical protein
MRIIRLKLKPAVSELLAEVSVMYSIEDVGFTEDLFSILRFKGAGLPNPERMEALAQAYTNSVPNAQLGLTLMQMRKRKHTLSDLAALPLFKSLALTSEPHVAVRRLLQVFREFSRKRRQAACLGCRFLTKCDFGKQYGQVVGDITRVVDPNYGQKVHPSCPDLPAIAGINALYDEMQKFNQMNSATAQGQAVAALTPSGPEYLKALDAAEEEFEEDPQFSEEEDTSLNEATLLTDDLEEQAEKNGYDFESGNAGKGGVSRAGTHGGKHFAKTSETFVNQLSVQSLQLFELGRLLDSMLAAGLGDKFKPTQEISKRQDRKRLTESNEFTKISSSDHALPDDHLDAKFVKRDLTVHSFAKPEQKKHLLYVLVDESGSMRTQICDGNPHALLTRGQVATTLAGALCKRVGDDGGMMFLRFFSDSTGNLQAARTKTEFDTLLEDVVQADMNGGGTSIARALRTAHTDISQASDEVSKAEILLVTDMDDRFSDIEARWIATTFTATGVKLNVLNVKAIGQPSYGNAHEVLRKVATKYLQVDGKSLNLQDIVQLVK